MATIKTLSNRVGKIKDAKLYKPEDIVKLRVVVNSNLVPSVFTVYRLIKSGALPAVNMSTIGKPRYFVRGADLKRLVRAKLRTVKFGFPVPVPKKKARKKKR